MTLSLIWRPAYPPGPTPKDAPAIETSLSPHEAAHLQYLAEGRSVLEIGSAYGYSTVTMAKVASHVLAVDPHDSPIAIGGSLNQMLANLEAHRVVDRVTVLVAFSQEILPLLRARFGLVFIDGNHRHRYVLSDLFNSEKLLAPGGQIAVHDYEEASCPDVASAVRSSGIPGRLVADTLWASDP